MENKLLLNIYLFHHLPPTRKISALYSIYDETKEQGGPWLAKLMCSVAYVELEFLQDEALADAGVLGREFTCKKFSRQPKSSWSEMSWLLTYFDGKIAFLVKFFSLLRRNDFFLLPCGRRGLRFFFPNIIHIINGPCTTRSQPLQATTYYNSKIEECPMCLLLLHIAPVLTHGSLQESKRESDPVQGASCIFNTRWALKLDRSALRTQMLKVPGTHTCSGRRSWGSARGA